MAGRASIVGAAETSVGKVRDHNEDSHFIDPELGIFVVCDGMGGHAAGEVASALAVQTIRTSWASQQTQKVADAWLAQGTPDARKQLLITIQQGVFAAHEAIVAEAAADSGKSGMGTTLVGAIIVGGDIVFAHAGDSRAYIVRDGIAMQLTEDHTLLARLLAAGIDVDVEGDGMRFKSMLTNALGIGHECKVSTFVVPLADGDRFLLCSDGITEYVSEAEVGEVLSTQPSPARSAQRLVELALQRGGGDNATALVIRVLEAGETSRPSDLLKREQQAIQACPLWAKINPQQRLRALRIALPRDYPNGDKLPAQTLGDRVAWIVVEGELEQDGHLRGPGSLLYPEALLSGPLPDKDGLAVAQSEVRALALRADDFRELCDEDPELGELLLGALASEIALRRPHRRRKGVSSGWDIDGREATDPGPASPSQLAAAPDTEPTQPARGHLRQPRASTVPPTSVRKRSNTDRGAPVPDRTPAAPAAADTKGEERQSEPTIPGRPIRGDGPPARGSDPTIPERGPLLQGRPSSPLIIAPTDHADTEAALDRALSEMSEEADQTEATASAPVDGPPTNGTHRSDDSQPEIFIDTASDVRAHHLSEPEIQIEALEMVADEPPPEEHLLGDATVTDGAVGKHTVADPKPPETDGSAKVVEVLKDTSSQTITMVADADAERPEN